MCFKRLIRAELSKELFPKVFHIELFLQYDVIFAKNLLVSSPPIIESNESIEQLQISDETSHVAFQKNDDMYLRLI